MSKGWQKMSKEMQIEEIAKDLCQNTFCSLEEWNKCKLKVGEYCANCRCMAERLYTAGYRKQSENTVEVVRCKDCRRKQIDAFGRTVCVRNGKMIAIQDEDYCSYAERR